MKYKSIVLALSCYLGSSGLANADVTTHLWHFGSGADRDGDAGMQWLNSSGTNGEWMLARDRLEFDNRYVEDPDDGNFTEAVAWLDLQAWGFRPGMDFTLWLQLDIGGISEWNRFGLFALAPEPGEDLFGEGFSEYGLSGQVRLIRGGVPYVAIARGFRGRNDELARVDPVGRLEERTYRMMLSGRYLADGSLILEYSMQADDDDEPWVVQSNRITTPPEGTAFGFGGRFRAYQGTRQPSLGLRALRVDIGQSQSFARYDESLAGIGIWTYQGKLYRYRVHAPVGSINTGPVAASVLLEPGVAATADSGSGSRRFQDSKTVFVELNASELPADAEGRMAALSWFQKHLPGLIYNQFNGLVKIDPAQIHWSGEVDRVPELRQPAAISPGKSFIASRRVVGPTPSVLAYNLGHFKRGSNTRDWWNYGGATGARIFINPAHFERNHTPPRGDSDVTDLESFLHSRAQLSNNPDDPHYIDLAHMKDRLENHLLNVGPNRIHGQYALEHLREHSPDILVVANMSPGIFHIENDDDWTGKWRLWRSYFSMVYHYASEYGVQRYSFHNEPNHPDMFIEPEAWLMRAAICADAAEQAMQAVNRKLGTEMTVHILAPVTAGDVGDPNTGPYVRYGNPLLQRWTTNFLGEKTDRPLYTHYAYQSYSDSADRFVDRYMTLRNRIAEDLPWGMPMPELALTEFNVHHGRFFDSIPESTDSPEKFMALGEILVGLMEAGLREMYLFKFGLTRAMPGRTYHVHKNGMFHSQNRDRPFDHGGPTRAADLYRMFIDAFHPGRERFEVIAPQESSSLRVTLAQDADSGDLYVFSLNPTLQDQSLSMDFSAWSHDISGDILIRELSVNSPGHALPLDALDSDFGWNAAQPPQSAWLLRLPAGSAASEHQRIESQWAQIRDLGQSVLWSGNAQTDDLMVYNPAVSGEARQVALLSFEIDTADAQAMQAALLELKVKLRRKGDSNEPIQAQVFLLPDASLLVDANRAWQSIEALRSDVEAGAFLSNRVVRQSDGEAVVVGQIQANSEGWETVFLDVTSVIAKHPGPRPKFLVVQEPRWDVHPSQTKVEGDYQDGALMIKTRSTDAPALHWLNP
jgi:hypothetical protein